MREIDDNYFRNYAGGRKKYDSIYQEYSRVDDCLQIFQNKQAPKISSVAVLGTATGKVLHDLFQHFQVPIYGCEISAWAYARIRMSYRRYICLQDMRDFVQQAKIDGRKYDLVFTNSLVYLAKEEIPSFLTMLSRVAFNVHFHSSFKGDCCKDPYRKTLESYAWWNQQFRHAGYTSVAVGSRNQRYLWGLCR